MKLPVSLSVFALLLSFLSATSAHTHENFLQCLTLHSGNDSISEVIYTSSNSSYSFILESSIRNPRFSTPSTPKPLVIVTPLGVSQIQEILSCAQKHGMQVRVRSGGHDYEGLSYVSPVPFVILDMINLRNISVDEENSFAWVQSGATLGELYYEIAEQSKTLGFPAGLCPTIGVGGHFSGGGYGTILRKYGLAADHVIDAHLIDVKGRFLDRKSMGEDLFWAIRGGGGASFGVIVAWKIKLVPVPSTVTVFTVNKNLEQNATKILYRWQYVADKFDKDLFIRVILTGANSSQEGKKTVQATFNSLYLGGKDKLLPLMQKSFPELGLVSEDCTEMSWIQSVLYFAGFQSGQALDVLLNRTLTVISYKAKSDYVKNPIPESGLEGIWQRLYEKEAELGGLILTPYGGKMSEISESAIPFPHRAGNIYKIQYIVYWSEEGTTATESHVSWIRRLYAYMAPYVSKSPREAYINYRDLDIAIPHLFNPFSRVRIQLPSIPNEFLSPNIDRDYFVQYLRKIFIAKAVLLTDPSRSNNFGVVVICGSLSRLAFCKKGDTTWTELAVRSLNTYQQYVEYSDIIFHDNQVYVLASDASVEVWDFRSAFPTKIMSIDKPSTLQKVVGNSFFRHNLSPKFYLVKTSTDFFFIKRFIGDFVNAEGLVVDGDYVLCNSEICPYISHKAVLSLQVEFQAEHMVTDSVYFTDDRWDEMDVDDSYDGHDIGFSNLDDQSIKPYYRSNLARIDPPPIWITPNLSMVKD
uniref:FAD-binding PCMH-type domain-containing protein n=1 Tax=Quercus lobata TaxID=97700 RepID=A0A7N2LT96_QUELO